MEIVSFEIAKKLKEKGFNWSCSHYYRTKCKDLFMVFPCEDWSDVEERINAPTISQVLKWLREENIHLYTDIDDEGWFFEIKCLKTGFMVNTDFFKRYSTYELATLAGIEYVIDNLI